jgi:uncharacterized lipoprotein YmbA
MSWSTRHLRRWRCTTGSVALLACLAGCTASPPPRLFLLAPRAPASTESFAGTISLKTVDIPAYLDRPQLVRLNDPYELQVSELERWGEATQEMVTRVLASDLGLRLPAGHVVPASGPLSVSADVVLEVDISRFDAEPEGTVVLAGQWVVKRDDRPRRLRAARIRVQPEAPSTPALVAAMSEALGQLADQIALSIAEPAKQKASAKSLGRDELPGAPRSGQSR